MSRRPITVLVTGAGAPGAPGIIQSLRLAPRKIKILVTDVKPHAAGFALADKSFLIPPAKQAQAYLRKLLSIAKRHRVQVILPINTAELTLLSKHRADFPRHGTVVSVSPQAGLRLANDKHLLLKRLDGVVPTPHSRLVRSLGQMRAAIREYGYPKRPVVLKPPVANGSRGMRILAPGVDRLALLLEQKPDATTTTWKEIESVFRKAKPFPKYLVMEYLPGAEYSVDVLADNGTPVVVVPRHRDAIKGGISVAGTIVRDQEIISYSRKIIEHLGLHGNIGFQFKRNAEGTPKIIESNPRLQGTVVMATYAGANMAYMAVQLALGERIVPPKKIKWGMKMVRHWSEVYWYKNKLLRKP